VRRLEKLLKYFLQRHPRLTLRPQGLSYTRATSFTPEAVSHFFSFFEPAVEKISPSPAILFNCDETGITMVQHRHTKVLGLKGKHQISALQVAQHEVLIIVVTYMKPTGGYIPPLLIFPRKKMELMNCTPPGSICACHMAS
jgi:hypothetical protein